MRIDRLTNRANCTRRVFTKSLRKANICGMLELLKFNLGPMRKIKKSLNSRNFLVKPRRALKPSAFAFSDDFLFINDGLN
jgi:hypothetical protein